MYDAYEMRSVVLQSVKEAGGSGIIADDINVFFKNQGGQWMVQPVYIHPYGIEPESVTNPAVIANLNSTLQKRTFMRVGVAMAAVLTVAASVVAFMMEAESRSTTWNDSTFKAGAFPMPNFDTFRVGGYDPMSGQWQSGSMFSGGLNYPWHNSASFPAVPNSTGLPPEYLLPARENAR